MSNPFIKNENSVLPILIERNFQQKIYFCLLKMRSIIYNEGKSNFFLLNLDRDYRNHFLNFMLKIQDFSFHNFWKKMIVPRHTPAQGFRLSPSDWIFHGIVTIKFSNVFSIEKWYQRYVTFRSISKKVLTTSICCYHTRSIKPNGSCFFRFHHVPLTSEAFVKLCYLVPASIPDSATEPAKPFEDTRNSMLERQ